jgi:DNA-binding beta-propeller fold protein YncE
MSRWVRQLVTTVSGLVVAVASGQLFAAEPQGPILTAFRSPVAVAVVANGERVVSANADSGTLSLIDPVAGVVHDELAIGREPAWIAAAGHDRVVATTLQGGDLVIVSVAEDDLQETARVHLGLEPAGVAVSPDGRLACVTLSAVDRAVVVDLATARVRGEVVVGRLPRHVAFSPQGQVAAVTCSAESGVVLVDVEACEVVARHPFKGLNVGQPGFAADGRTLWFPWTYDGGSHPSPGNIRRGWVTGSRLGRLSLDAADGEAPLAGLTLDVSGKAVGDVRGLAVVDGGATQFVTAGGTHELLRLHEPSAGGAAIPYTQISGLEVMDRGLAADPVRFSRLDLGGRPLGIAVDEPRQRAYVANRLRDSLQVIDLARFELVAEVSLRPEPLSDEASLVRQGEAIFFDATRSLDQWYSCHTCHYEGGSNTVTFDTLNDGSTGSYKTVLPLYRVADTGPWTWHGWQQDFDASLAKSLVDTMQGPKPSPADVEALAAYLRTLEPPISPYREADGSLSATAERGERLFMSARAGCTECHAGSLFTSEGLHDVGLARSSDRYEGFSPPSLLALHRKTRFLHTGKAKSLEEVLTKYHAPDQVLGLEPLSAGELEDLVAYLQSL